MFEYLKEIVAKIGPAYIVLNVSGIEYEILCPTPYGYQENQPAAIYAGQVVRGIGIALYGFLSLEDRELFLELLGVSGIRPKSAVAIMATEGTDSLTSVIQSREVKYLTRSPEAEEKTASQIVLNLEGKLGDYVKKSAVATDLTPSLRDALLALITLGRTQKEVDRVTPELAKLPENTADGYIKEALALLLRK